MYIIVAPIQIKPGFRDRFVEEMVLDAKGSVENEPGCLRFDVVQDGDDPNRIWLYEVYKGRGGFRGAHEGAALHQVARRHCGVAGGRSHGRGTRRLQRLAAGPGVELGPDAAIRS